MPTGNMTFKNLYYKTVNENGEPIGEPIKMGDTITLQFNEAYPYEPTWMELGLRARITNVIFNPPATIVFWNDKTKTVVKCQDGDEWDAEKGLAMAIAKKYFGNKGRYNKEFQRWLPESEEESFLESVTNLLDRYKEEVKRCEKLWGR